MTVRLADRIEALRTAVNSCRGRVAEDIVDDAQRVVARADQRLALAGDVTVVALAGATGSGKSSLFNALTEADFASTGVRRPTTSRSMAVTFGETDSGDVLEWLQVPQRHRVPGNGLDSMVLLDLPDHDSTVAAHREEVDRLVQLVDVLVWVLDPQKYADAALHEGYLRPLAHQAPTMLVALNQVDRLPAEDVAEVVDHLRGLLSGSGLGRVEVVPVSAQTGSGLSDLRSRLRAVVSGKKAAAERLAADVGAVAARLAEHVAPEQARGIPRRQLQQLQTSLEDAAGVSQVADAVQTAWRQRGARATGWPLVAWLGRFRPDPLRRLHLDRLTRSTTGEIEKREADPTAVSRTSLSGPSGVQQARVDSAVRAVAEGAAGGLPLPWQESVRAAARSHRDSLPSELDRAVAATDLQMDRRHGWWRLVTLLQWLLILVVAVGLGWLAVDFTLRWFQLPPLPRVDWWGWPAPTLLVAAGVMAGIVLAMVSRVGVVVGAGGARRRVHQRLRAAIGEVTDELVVNPVEAELDRHDRAWSAVRIAQGRRR